MGAIKLASLFFFSNLLLGSLSFLIAILLKDSDNPILNSIHISILLLIVIGLYIRKTVRSFVSLRMAKPVEIFFIILLFLFGLYIMQKSFSYSNGVFEIASNQYVDFSGHIPIIRSFSLGDNIPPVFPYYASAPNTYHFMFDYLVALYEKIGFRIDYVLNILSAGAFAFVCILIYYIAHELFGKNKMIGILSVVFFLFNSSLSFVDAIKRYGLNSNPVSNIYHHNIYLGNGPFGESFVSVFWNLNTYLNQRHFLFGLGIGLLVIYFILTLKRFSKKTLILLALTIGILPLWHMTIFISLIVILGTLAILEKTKRKDYLTIIILAILIALPQLIYISMFSDNQIVFRAGFLVSQNLNIFNFANYWFLNLGVSLITIPLGVFFVNKKQKLFFVGLLPLFILPNLFQFGAQIFDNHKFFNVFIIFANMYSAYVIYLLLRKKVMFKVLGLVLIFVLTFSGIIDFFVIKNDIKAKIPDYPSSKFQSWVLKNIPKDSIFLSNKPVYDPVNLAGRQSYLGEPHYLFLFGKNPDERISKMNALFTSKNIDEIRAVLSNANISYIAIYKDGKKVESQSVYENNFKKIYGDQDVSLLSF